MRNLQNLIVFPDEIDSDNEGSKKKNRKKRNTPFTEQEKNLSCNWRETALTTWKSGSVFRSCKKLSCDPLHSFSEVSTCHTCRKIRAKLFSRYCITFPKNTLRNVFLDYLYFHTILIFDKEAELRFSSENPNNLYLINYRKIKCFNATLVQTVADMFQFSDNMKSAVEQHSEIAHVSQRNIGLEHFCEVCGNDPNVPIHWMVLKNRRYRIANFKMISRKKGEDEENIVRLCATHANVFKVYFYLYHMDWIVHWNCYHWVQAVMAKSKKTLSSEEIIDQIDPNNYKYLTTHLVGFYKKMDSYATAGPHQSRVASEWKALVFKWKCGMVLQSCGSVKL